MSKFSKLLVALLLGATTFAAHAAPEAGPRASVTQALDEEGFLNLDIRMTEADQGSRYLDIRAWAPFQGKNTKNGNFPSDIAKGIEIYLDGHRWRADSYQPDSLTYAGNKQEAYKTGLIPILREGMKVEIRFYGQPLSQYEVREEKGLVSVGGVQKLSRFHVRKFSEIGKVEIAKGTYEIVDGTEVNQDLKEWMKNPSMLSDKTRQLSPLVDLHTHFAAAIRTEDLIRIATELRIPYPVKNVQRMELDYRQESVYQVNGIEYVPFSKENISFSKFHSGHDYYWSSLYDGFEIHPSQTISFDRMELLYKMRDPIVKNPAAFPAILEALAQDYQRNGVKYVELSFYSIVKPEFLQMANDLIPKLEAKYGVQLRFLTGMRRHNDTKHFNMDIKENSEAMRKSPYVVGVDLMGHETNATAEFGPTLAKLHRQKKEFPNMVLRVHAGENPNHADNILEAIKFGATRIGHGIYGVTDEVVALAKKNDVIIEFNFNSNLALQNIDSARQLKEAALKYLKGGVRVTFGTDGHGMYHSSPQSELAVARALGFTEAELGLIRKSDQAYINKMKGDFTSRSTALSQGPQVCSKIFD